MDSRRHYLAALLFYAFATGGCRYEAVQREIDRDGPPVGAKALDGHGDFFRSVSDRSTRTSVLFHDRQAMIRRPQSANPEYGPTATVAVDANLIDTLSTDRFTPFQYPWPKVLIAEVDVSDRPSQPDDAWQAGRTCVYLLRNPSIPFKISAVAHHSAAFEPCATIEQATEADTLKLRKDGDADPVDQLPAVARWETDNARRMYFGIKCPWGWCMIGDKVANPSSGSGHGPGRKRKNKGWHDQQRLALENQGSLRPSPLLATVFPLDTLERISDDSLANAFRHVANIEFRRDQGAGMAEFQNALDAYRDKWNLPVSIRLAEDDRIEVWLKRATEDSIQERSGYFVAYRNGNELGRSTASLAIAWHRIDRALVPFFPIVPPGAARWGWRDDDESVWVRCGSGCCEMGFPAP